ncbi:MAG: hypothetical protein RL662_857 [Bacteroidota bacterium]|jgi:hypothetical protein
MQELLSPKDLDLLLSKKNSTQELEEQITYFKKGFPFLKIANTATPQKGITIIDSLSLSKYIADWDQYLQSNHKVIKFVPASGAASRMFKDLFEFSEGISDLPESEFMIAFFVNIKKFAFHNTLNDVCFRNTGSNIDQLIVSNHFKTIVKTLLLNDGLNYGNLPKGLLEFHANEDYSRTPVEEHLVEGSQYAKSKDNTVNIHFTVSQEHKNLFETLLKRVLEKYELQSNSKFEISFSEQKSKTDTIAVDSDNNPFRENDKLVFRPGGHGALIENLNDLDADVIFIKNIDNVIPDALKVEETKYKKALAGYLICIQQRVFDYLKRIDSGIYKREDLLEMLHFLQNELNVKNPDTKNLEDSELVLYLKRKLNRPTRVCGMVKNIGEPGGGPFFAVNEDGTISLQILESSQVDLDDPEKKELFNSGTHFNPVDLVCGVKNYLGEKFDLPLFVDKNTGFISKKSKNGKELKALELPGLWNGAMSDWNTIFIEVPLSTFNPVKNVNDLLRKEHQNK